MLQTLLQVFITFNLQMVFQPVRGLDICDDPIARTEAGLVRGICKLSENNNTYVSFLGVEYAEQPVGERRFRKLLPRKPYSYVFNAIKNGPICPQNSPLFLTNPNSEMSMSESCINANIHVPLKAFPGLKPIEDRKAVDLVPILVFIHGGGFLADGGSSLNFGPEYMIDENVMIVTFNYRLQALGFLYTNSTEFPGNYGLRDMITLLQWVKANAKNFGGDPDNITLGGQSVGGVSVHLLMLSKAAEGLFKRSIIMSGVAILGLYSTSPKNALKSANIFLSAMNITSTDSKEIRQILIKKSLNEILEAAAQVREQYFGDLVRSFGPVVETQFTDDVVIDDDPLELVDRGRGKNYPAIIGFTNNEYQFYKPYVLKIDYLNITLENPRYLLSPDVVYRTDTGTANKFGIIVAKQFYNGKPTIEKLINILTTTTYIYPAINFARKRSHIGAEETYLYEFSYDPVLSSIEKFKKIKYKGSAHTEDLDFIFKMSTLFNKANGSYHRPSRDLQMMKQMTRYFKNFMTCSKPICERNLQYLWPPISPHSSSDTIVYEKICNPGHYTPRNLTKRMKNNVRLLDYVYSQV